MRDKGFRHGSVSSYKTDHDEHLNPGIRLWPNLCFGEQSTQWVAGHTEDEWLSNIFPKAAIYRGFDELIWKCFIIAVYKDTSTGKLSSLIIDRLGTTHLGSVDISRQSRFYPAIENLSEENQKSPVRKCIAVSLLKKYADLPPEMATKIAGSLRYNYDPTVAGDLANSCSLVDFCSPKDIGKSLSRLGFLQARNVHSVLLDVIYENTHDTINSNNELVFHLGEQLEQLFNPLAEYSPEQTESVYIPPEDDKQVDEDSPLVNSICNELLQVQSNFTLTLVEFLQKFLIPLRIMVSSDEIETLSISKLNRLFPPTIDEVIRINCIFLDALKAAIPYGSKEILNACSITIPYFYKAYTRHEAATKHFTKDLKLFMSKFRDIVPSPELYSEMKLDTIIKGPQEIIMKLKLIVDRLWTNKTWDPSDLEVAQSHYTKVIGLIDSFGNFELPVSSYSTRVFTPSGKIMTELAKGWPPELQYKWLKRKVVGVFDVLDSNDDTRRNLLVIFNDFVVVLEILNDAPYYHSKAGNMPLLSNVLMNSLINEVPLPSKIPGLQVVCYSYIDDLSASAFGDDFIRLDSLNADQTWTVAFKVISSSSSASQVADLILKARVLEKDTAFHLFRFEDEGVQVFSTAHELNAYSREKIRSKFALFLNVMALPALLDDYDIFAAFFASITETGKVHIVKLISDGTESETTIELTELASFLVHELGTLLPQYSSSILSPNLPHLLAINEQLVNKVGRHFKELPGSKSTISTYQEEASREIFQVSNSPPKTFGTLTTFRSHSSDLKSCSSQERPPADDKAVVKKQHDIKKVAGKADHRSNDSTAKQRRYSIMHKFKNFFSRSSAQGPPHRQTAFEQPSKEAKYTKKNVHIKNSLTAKRTSVTTAEQAPTRMASVKHTPTIINPAAAPKGGAEDLHILPQGQMYTLASNGSEKVSDSSSGLCAIQKADRVSRVFNDDLYGDLSIEKQTQRSLTASPNQETDDESSKVSDSTSAVNRIQSENDEELPRSPELVDLPAINSTVAQEKNTALSKSHSSQKINLEPPETQYSTKAKMFPEVKRITLKNKMFERSPSFRELFENMRLVLDENDENSNWKRLPSDASLKAKLELRPDTKTNIHAFKSLVPSTRPLACAQPLTPTDFIEDHATSEVPLLGVDEEDKLIESSALEPLSISSEVSCQVSERPELKPIEKKEKIEKPRGKFRVINHSPARKINLDSHSPVTIDSSELLRAGNAKRQDFLFSSNLKSSENELLKDIQSDEGTDYGSPFYTPLENQVEVFGMGGDTEVQARGLRNSNHKSLASLDAKDLTNRERIVPTTSVIEETSEQPHLVTDRSPVQSLIKRTTTEPPYKNQSIDVSPDSLISIGNSTQNLLEEPEFSSFHMTFDATEEGQNFDSQLEDGKKEDGPPMEEKNRYPELIFYRFPGVAESSDTFFTCADGHAVRAGHGKQIVTSTNVEDDPIWVSPSKLDMFDLSMQPESDYLRTEKKQSYKNAEHLSPVTTLPKMKIQGAADDTLFSDSSYAYLGTLLLGEDEGDSGTDSDAKPTCLRFSS